FRRLPCHRRQPKTTVCSVGVPGEGVSGRTIGSPLQSPGSRTRVLLLSFPFFSKCRVTLGNVGLIAFRINERVRAACFHLWIFLLQSEVSAVRAEKKVTRQALETGKGFDVILRDLRVVLVAHQNVAGV